MATKTEKTQIDNLTERFEERFEEIVGSVRERLVETNEVVADSVTPYIPNVELSFIDRLPAPAEVVDGYFEFAGKAVKDSHKFVGQIVEAWTPSDAGAEADKVVATAKKATKKAASKTTKTVKAAAKTTKK